MIIFTESGAHRTYQYENVKKAIWFLSADFYEYKYKCKKSNFIKSFAFNLLTAKHRRFTLKNENIMILCGSKYAFDYVKEQGCSKPLYLVEPISKEFLDAGGIMTIDAALETQRGNAILYNPAKRSDLMDLLIKRGTFDYKPLKGYSADELIKLYRSSKLYIDFGGFPGPERIPKEAAFNGCNILVGKKGAAVNDWDVAIPEKYKLYAQTSHKE